MNTDNLKPDNRSKILARRREYYYENRDSILHKRAMQYATNPELRHKNRVRCAIYWRKFRDAIMRRRRNKKFTQNLLNIVKAKQVITKHYEKHVANTRSDHPTIAEAKAIPAPGSGLKS